MMPELRQKNSLFKAVKEDRVFKVKGNAMKALRLYKEYRKDRKVSDYLMEKNIHVI